MDPNQCAVPSDGPSDPGAGSGWSFQDWRMQLQDTVRQGYVQILTQALENRLLPIREYTAATSVEELIYKQAINERDYHTRINHLCHNLEKSPGAPQMYPGSNISFSNQYHIDQVPGMRPPQRGLNPSQNVVRPSTDQPSTSRQQQGQPLIQGLANKPRIVPGGPTGQLLELCPEAPQKYPGSNISFSNQYQIDQVPGMRPPQWGLNPSQSVVIPSTDQPSTTAQQQGQPLIHGLANGPRIVPGGPTGPFPVGMYSDTQRRQQEMQLQSENQMQYQQQWMMHQKHQMTEAQQNLLPLVGSVMMSAAPTAGMSNPASAMGAEQINNMTTLQKKQSESPIDFIQQRQQLHGKQRIDVGSCSAAADLTDDGPQDIYRKQEFLKKTHGMQLREIAHELLQVSIQVERLPPQAPFYEDMFRNIVDAKNKLDDLVKVLDFHVDTLPINLKNKLRRFEEFMPVVVKQVKLVIKQGEAFLRQQPLLQLQQGTSLTETGAPFSHSNNSHRKSRRNRKK